MRIGILFGGSSREREISFAGGRTVYDNLDKNLFTPVPIFIDSKHNYILLDWQYLYKGTIRDFYPPVKYLPASANQFQIYVESIEGLSPEAWEDLIRQVGRPIQPQDLPKLIDFAFLTLHGAYGEDGQVQGLLEALSIPYSGSGIRSSAIGIDKAFQKKIMEAGGFATPKMRIIPRAQWLKQPQEAMQGLAEEIGLPLVVRPANQGSSIGVSIVHKLEDLPKAMDAAFFMRRLSLAQWRDQGEVAQVQTVREWTDIRHGLGFPLRLSDGKEQQYFYHPERLLEYLNSAQEGEEILLEGLYTEHTVIIEEFIEGKEFSCVVIRNEDGRALALPPTEIRKGKGVFDYRAKYLAGLARKVTPIELPDEQIQAIRKACEDLFYYLEFNVYARIDGFFGAEGQIFLNDPNTTSGMLPSSFFFHQAAEIGLNPSQFLTYIIRTSLQERIAQSLQLDQYDELLRRLDNALQEQQRAVAQKKTIGVVLGGYSFERHISVESGRNIYEKLSSSAEYEPIPLFLTRHPETLVHEFWQIPINILLKDNADDILDKIRNYHKHPVIEQIKTQTAAIRQRFLNTPHTFEPRLWTDEDFAQQLDGVFIALHGRPGEDGELQKFLNRFQLPYNGSDEKTSSITIDKYRTLQTLREHGFATADQVLITKEEFLEYPQLTLDRIESQLEYPLIAKPMDDGCSAAVKKIQGRAQLRTYLQAMFRQNALMAPELEEALELKPKEEFPQKEVALLESLIQQGEAVHFLEITGGLLTHYNPDGSLRYEVFEPSETLASGAILSLEEKFLAGEGQNLTPARFTTSKLPQLSHEMISSQVRATLQKAAAVLGVTGYARIDAFVRIFADAKVETLIIEVNSLPGMTPATCIFHQCALNGYKPYEFIDAILKFGQQRQQQAQA
jgi:D-alanine-D-alanine ligase